MRTERYGSQGRSWALAVECSTHQVEGGVDLQCFIEYIQEYFTRRVDAGWMPGVAKLVARPVLVQPLRWTGENWHLSSSADRSASLRSHEMEDYYMLCV